jgi:putative membrane protein
MKTQMLFLPVALAIAALPAFAQTQAASTTMANDLPPQDKEFVQAASMSGSTEMVDHTKIMLQLKMAAPHGVAVPKDDSDTTVLDSLKGLQGKEFDTAYIKSVGVEAHQKAVEAFRKEAENGQNADLKTAAGKALPTIQEHLKMAQALAAKKGVQ